MFSNKPSSYMQGKERLLAQLEANDTKVKQANFDTYPMFPKDILRLAAIIKTNNYLEEISLMDCRLQTKDIPPLAEAMESNRTITAIYIEKFKDDSKEILDLIEKMHIYAERNKSARKPSSPIAR